MGQIQDGVGVVGGGRATFFSLGEPIWAKYPNSYQKDRLEVCIIQGEGRVSVWTRGRIIDNFQVTHPKFPEVVFTIAKHNFKCTQAMLEGIIIASKLIVERCNEEVEAPVAVAAVPNLEEQEERDSRTNATPTLRNPPAGREMTADEIAEVRAAGLVVENDNGPLPEDAAPPPANELPRLIGEWISPAICPRAADGFSMNKGKFKDKTWDSIAAMNKLQLWSL